MTLETLTRVPTQTARPEAPPDRDLSHLLPQPRRRRWSGWVLSALMLWSLALLGAHLFEAGRRGRKFADKDLFGVEYAPLPAERSLVPLRVRFPGPENKSSRSVTLDAEYLRRNDLVAVRPAPGRIRKNRDGVTYEFAAPARRSLVATFFVRPEQAGVQEVRVRSLGDEVRFRQAVRPSFAKESRQKKEDRTR